MKNFVQNYPQFRKMATNVSKHVAVMEQLSKAVDRRELLDLSEVEQEMACKNSPTDSFQRCAGLLEKPLDIMDKLRLILIYACRFDDRARVLQLTDLVAPL